MKFEKLPKMEAGSDREVTLVTDQATPQLALSRKRTLERSQLTRMDRFKSHRGLRYEITRFLRIRNPPEPRIGSSRCVFTGAQGPNRFSGLSPVTIRV